MFKLIAYNLIVFILIQSVVFGNDIEISNVSIINQNIEESYSEIIFDIEWQNSWRYDYSSGINNWDAAWVFAKFRAGITDPILTGVNSSGNLLTVNSTEGLRVGMPLMITAGSGSLSVNTVITSINSATSITVSPSPSSALEGAKVRAIRIWEHVLLDEAGHHQGMWLGDGDGAVVLEPGLYQHDAPFDATDNPAVGAFLYRSDAGYGTFKANGVRLRWNYGKQGISDYEIVDLKIFAIEMVYVPAGSFYIGSGGSETSAIYVYPDVGSPYKITSEDIIPVGTLAGKLYYNPSANSGDQSGPVPGQFPKGYHAFYSMKYSITQQQYVDFLNTLTRMQQDSRFAGSALGDYMFGGMWPGSSTPRYRNAVRIMKKPESPLQYVFGCDLNMNNVAGENNDGQNTAMNFLNQNDAAAFADWSGLRPLTELEYEKAARGYDYPNPNGFVWGTDQIVGTESTDNGYILIDSGQKNEKLTFNGHTTFDQGNSVWRGTARPIFSSHPFGSPVRVGIFANYVSNRVEAGASIWGIMELSGNLYQWTVSLGNASGRSFAGNHGNGTLNAYGIADENSWPLNPNGFGMRGGSFFHNQDMLRISDRTSAFMNPMYRSIFSGSRAVRTINCFSPINIPEPVVGNPYTSAGSIESFTTSGGNYYLWIVPEGYKIISGQGTHTVEVLTGQHTGQIRVALINDCGAGPERTLTIVIN